MAQIEKTFKKDMAEFNASSSNPVEPVVSSELIKAEYDGYRAYHTYTNLKNCPYSGELN